MLQVRIQDLVSELGAKEDELHRLRLERDDLRRVVASLDAERDRVQVGEVQAMDRVQVAAGNGLPQMEEIWQMLSPSCLQYSGLDRLAAVCPAPETEQGQRL